MVGIISSFLEAICRLFTKEGKKFLIKNNENAIVYQAGRDINVFPFDYEMMKRLLIEVLDERDKKADVINKASIEHENLPIKLILECINSGTTFTTLELASKTGLSNSIVKRYIKKLLQEGVIVQTGERKKAHYNIKER